MPSYFKTTFLPVLAALSLSACATMSMDDHQRKYADLSLEKILANKAENQALMQPALIERMRNDYDGGRYNSAIRHAKLVLKVSPENSEAQYYMADALLKTSNPVDAEPLFLALSETDPRAEVHQGYGLSLLAQNKHEAAQPWLNKAVLADSNLWRSWNGLGIIYGLSEDWESSEAAFKAAMNGNGNKAAIYNNLGMSYLRQDRLSEAVIVFANAHNLSGPDQPMDLFYRTALALTGDMATALQGATDKDAADLYNQLGMKAMKKGNRAKAVQYLKLAIARSPSVHKEAEKNLSLAQTQLP